MDLNKTMTLLGQICTFYDRDVDFIQLYVHFILSLEHYISKVHDYQVINQIWILM